MSSVLAKWRGNGRGPRDVDRDMVSSLARAKAVSNVVKRNFNEVEVTSPPEDIEPGHTFGDTV